MLGESRVAGKMSGTVEMTSLDESPPFAFGSVAVPRATRLGAGLARIARSLPWAVCLITAVAAAMRFAEVDDVSANQFYDAAVRSMSLSWHNFFFGAFDPGGILAVDKPPLDLWLQVLSVKLLGGTPRRSSSQRRSAGRWRCRFCTTRCDGSRGGPPDSRRPSPWR